MKTISKKLVLSLLVSSTLALSGCGESANDLYLEAQSLELESRTNSEKLEEALEKYQEADELGSVEASFFLLQYYFQNKSFSECHKYLEKVAQKYPKEYAYYKGALLLNGANGKNNEEEATKLLNEALAAGLKQANYELGHFYFKNNRYDLALQFLLEAARSKDSRAYLELSQTVLEKEVKVKDYAEIVGYLNKALSLDPKNYKANILIVKCYLDGIGIASNLELASRHLKSFIKDTKDEEVQYLYAKYLIYQNAVESRQKGYDLLKKLAVENENKDAAYDLYLYHKSGIYEVAKDPKQAIFFARIAQKKDDYRADIALANAYLVGFGVNENLTETFNFAKKAYDLAPYSIEAMLLLGKCYTEGIGTERDDELGYKLLDKAAKEGSEEALLLKGIMLFQERAVSEIDHEELLIMEELAAKGNPDASYYYGLMLYDGIGIKRDVEKAIKYFEKANLDKHPDGMFNLGRAYDELGMVDKEIAVYRKLSTMDSPFKAESFAILGEIFDSLDDTKESISNYQEAIKLGNDTAAFNLGVIYYEQKEYGLAMEQFTSISKSVPKANVFIGMMYQNGLGIEANEIRALEWYDKAVAKNDVDGFYFKAALLNTGKDIPPIEKEKQNDLFLKAACGKNEEAALFLGTRSSLYEFDSQMKNAWLAYTELNNGSSRAAALLNNNKVEEKDKKDLIDRVKITCANLLDKK